MPARLLPLICALALGLALAPGARAETPANRIGVLDYRGSEHSLAHWRATERALNRTIPDQRFELVPLDLQDFDAALAAGQLDFVITNPGHYADLEYHHHISRIATAQGDDPVASTLVTAGDLTRLTDLAGQRLAITAPEAFGGFQVIWGEMAGSDAALPDRVELVVTGYPMQQAARAVLDGRADAAVLRACLLETLQASDPGTYGALRPFAVHPDPAVPCAVSSRVYPGWPFAKTAQTPPELAKAVAVALLQMEAGNLWTVPLDYQPVHDLFRALKIGPYARTGPVSLTEFIADYRDWLIAIGVALVFWALYSVRIETLVRRRTRALNEANAGLRHEMAERRRAEEADRQHRRELEHVARLSILGEMASSIAHELNQPLAAISTYAQGSLMQLKTGTANETTMTQAASEIAAQADRAALVIRRIRAFVRKRERQLAPVDLAALLRETAQLFEAPTRRAGVRVDMALTEDLPPVVADRVQLQQVILNLVQNAVDAMADALHDDRHLTIRCARQSDPLKGPGLCLSVRDRGCGLAPAAMARFAEPFHTTKPEGIGLGLALSRSIIEAHEGWLRAETPADGTGLRVMIWLPVDQPPGPHPEDEDTAP